MGLRHRGFDAPLERNLGQRYKPQGLHGQGPHFALTPSRAYLPSLPAWPGHALMQIPWRGCISCWQLHSMTRRWSRWSGCPRIPRRRRWASDALATATFYQCWTGTAMEKQTPGRSTQLKSTGCRNTYAGSSRMHTPLWADGQMDWSCNLACQPFQRPARARHWGIVTGCSFGCQGCQSQTWRATYQHFKGTNPSHGGSRPGPSWRHVAVLGVQAMVTIERETRDQGMPRLSDQQMEAAGGQCHFAIKGGGAGDRGQQSAQEDDFG